jgi:hypothetical protein
LAVKRKRET